MSFLVQFVDDVDEVSPKRFEFFQDAYLAAEARVQTKSAAQALIYQFHTDCIGDLIRAVNYKSSDEEISRAREQAWLEAQAKGISLAQFLGLALPPTEIKRRL